MSEISIKVDGQAKRVAADQKPTHFFAEQKEIVVCRVNGELKDLKSARDLVKSSNLNLKTFKPREIKDLKELRERYQELTKVEMR